MCLFWWIGLARGKGRRVLEGGCAKKGVAGEARIKGVAEMKHEKG